MGKIRWKLKNLGHEIEKVIKSFLKTKIRGVILGVLSVFLIGIAYLIFGIGQHSSAVKTAEWPLSSQSTKRSVSSEEAAEDMVVDVKGEVVRPGVYHMGAGSRISEVIQKAGGFTDQADEKSVNLAQKIKDEAVINVAKKGEATFGVENSGSSEQTSSAKVNINTADSTKLQTLTGIGAKKAQDIIDYRAKNGPFKSVDDLGNVAGFGDKTLEKLKSSITVE